MSKYQMIQATNKNIGAVAAGALTQAFTEYSRKTVEKEKKPSVLKKLRDLSAVVKGKVLERTKEKQRGQSR